jgi:hypothetical protein
MPQTGICVRCGRIAPLEALSFTPRFGRDGHYVRKEDRKYCPACKKAIESSKERIEKLKERRAYEAKRRKESGHYDDSRDRYGKKRMEYDY